MKTIRVILADDHEVVRNGVHSHLHDAKDIEIVGEANNGLALLDLVDKLHPDVVVADIEMAGLNGLETLAQAIKRYPKLGGVILSMHDDRPYIKRALQYGIHGFVSKLDKSADIATAIRQAAIQRRYLSPRAQIHAPSDNDPVGDEDPINPLEVLTPRQRQVVQLIMEGHTNAETADILGISVRTVEVHRAEVMKKLDLKTPLDLIRFAAKHGMIAKK